MRSSPISPSTAPPVVTVPTRRWQSTTFRWLTTYALIFSISVTVLVGFIVGISTNVMTRTTDHVLDWQLIYFDAIPDRLLPAAIHQRLEHERMHTNFYGLFAPNGTQIAGDIVHFPSGVTLDMIGKTQHHGVELIDGQRSPVVRAMAELRPDGSRLLVARDLTHIMTIRDTIIQAMVVGGLLCLGTGIAGGLILSMRQLRRVRDMRHVTQRIAQGDLQQRLTVGGRDELDMLAHLVNHMLDEVERLMNEVKSACDGIAHDLRTPLAHVRALLGQIADRAETANDAVMDEMVDRARSETDLLLNRFRAILRISEIGTLRRRGGFALLDLTELVEEIGELYEPLAESMQVGWSVQAEKVQPIHGDRALLFEALSNLIDNAIKFVDGKGAVHISLVDTPQGPRLEIVDNGPGIAASDRQAVLQPFYRSEQTMHIEGSGLGLGIVVAVLGLHDFTLQIGDAAPGARMSIECWPHTLA